MADGNKGDTVRYYVGESGSKVWVPAIVLAEDGDQRDVDAIGTREADGLWEVGPGEHKFVRDVPRGDAGGHCWAPR